MKAAVELMLGRCDAFEADMRAAADRNPVYEIGRSFGEAGSGASAVAFEALVARAGTWPLPPGGSAILVDVLRARRAITLGDFGAAMALARRATASLARDTANGSIFFLQFSAHAALAEAATEAGEGATAQRAAEAVASQAKAWAQDTTLNHGVDMSLAIARLAYPIAEPPPPAFAVLRKSWIEERLADGAGRGHVWSYAWAAPALTAREAEEAIAALPELGAPASLPPITVMPPYGNPEAETGRVYLLAGRVDEAIPHLRAALKGCDLFVAPREHVQAELNLGQAYETKRDRPAACGAYASVLARWQNAKPRSVSAGIAKTRRKALDCP
jgi:eukaryotic-like serine/threonine-protein kinase